jgi:hypothetical protein
MNKCKAIARDDFADRIGELEDGAIVPEEPTTN